MRLCVFPALVRRYLWRPRQPGCIMLHVHVCAEWRCDAHGVPCWFQPCVYSVFEFLYTQAFSCFVALNTFVPVSRVCIYICVQHSRYGLVSAAVCCPTCVYVHACALQQHDAHGSPLDGLCICTHLNTLMRMHAVKVCCVIILVFTRGYHSCRHAALRYIIECTKVGCSSSIS